MKEISVLVEVTDSARLALVLDASTTSSESRATRHETGTESAAVLIRVQIVTRSVTGSPLATPCANWGESDKTHQFYYRLDALARTQSDGRCRARTDDLLGVNEALSQLS